MTVRGPVNYPRVKKTSPSSCWRGRGTLRVKIERFHNTQCSLITGYTRVWIELLNSRRMFNKKQVSRLVYFYLHGLLCPKDHDRFTGLNPTAL